jgi:pyrroloquinoline-quinone synthase
MSGPTTAQAKAPPEAEVSVPLHATLAECRHIVDRRRYARHPFVAELERRRPDRSALGRWAVQKYHQVYLQNTIFSQIHANAQDYEDVRAYAMEQLIAEETGLTSGSAGHYVLMRRFAEACGAGPANFMPAAASAQVRAYVATLNTLCGQPRFVLGLLTIHAIESQSAEGVAKLLAWLRANHHFDEAELEWFRVHAEEDDDHAEAGMKLIHRYADTVPDLADRGPECVAVITEAWLRLQDFYLGLLDAPAVP